MKRTYLKVLITIAGLAVGGTLLAKNLHKPARTHAAAPVPAAPTPAEIADQENRKYIREWAEKEFSPELRAKPLEFFAELTRRVATRTKLGFSKGDSQASFAANVVREQIGQCGETAAVVKTVAEEFGFPARYVNLNNFPKPGVGHTQIEVWIDGAWHLFDPTFGVVYKDEKGRLLSFGLLHQRPELADRYRTKMGTSIPEDNKLFELFTGTQAFAARDSSGPVGSMHPTVYVFPIRASAPDGQGRVWKLGEVNSSGDDLVDSNPKGGLPVGSTFIGDGVLTNNWHRYVLSGLTPGKQYQMRLQFRGGTPGFAARLIDVQHARIDGGWSFALDNKAHPAEWTICLTPNASESEFTIWHAVRGKAHYGQLDAMDLRESNGTCPANSVASLPIPLVLPVQTPIDRGAPDAQGIVREKMADGRLVYSPFTVALQAMEGAAGLDKYKTVEGRAGGLIPRMEGSASKDDPVAKNALRWLIDNSFELSDGSLVWYYEFENTYNNVVSDPPWPSAFGQAYVLRALVRAAKNGDKEAADAARRAAGAFALPISQGGLHSTLPGGDWFFEEIPADPAPHILNGHMVSTLTLLEAAEQLKDDRIREYAEKGLTTLRRVLPLYDTGYWSRYDLNPKNTEWLLRFSPDSASARMGVVALALIAERSGDRRAIDMSQTDGRGANRLSGMDWSGAARDNGAIYREVRFGPDLHAKTVAGGTRQNTYAVFEPPGEKPADWTTPEPLVLEIQYLDIGAGNVKIENQSIAHGNTLQFVPIPGAEIHLVGDKKRKTARFEIPSQSMAWYMGPDYQQYHIELLQRLATATKDPLFGEYAERWGSYLKNWSDPAPVAPDLSKSISPSTK